MAETETPATAILINYHCDECGVMIQYVGFDIKHDPNVYLHQCPGCQRPYRFPIQYPTVRYRPT